MSNFRKFISMSAVAVLGVTNLLAPLSYADAAKSWAALTSGDLEANPLTFLMPEHDVFLYAITEPNTYYVEFHGNNGTGTMERQKFEYDEVKNLTTNAFTRTGYTYSGWNTDPAGGGTAYTDEQSVSKLTPQDSGTVDMYAQWNVNGYKITYDLNDKSGSSSGVLDPEPENEITYVDVLEVANPSRTGYNFSGWDISGMDTEQHTIGSETSNAASVSGTKATSFQHLRATSGTVEFLAQWSAKLTPYKVKHYQQNINDDEYTLKDTDNLSGYTDEVADHTSKSYSGFENPNIIKDPESGTINADESTVITYQYPRSSYNLTLVPGRGVATVAADGTRNDISASSITVTSGFKYEEPVVLSFTLKQGYTGGAWTGTNNNDSSFTMPNEAITKTASADVISYNIVYKCRNADEATCPANRTYNVESADITIPDNLTRDHSVFKGWTGGKAPSYSDITAATKGVQIASGSTENREYSAVWDCVDGYHFVNTGSDTEACEANLDTEYIVEHYQQQLDEGYTIVSADTETLSGATDSPATWTSKPYVGFSGGYLSGGVTPTINGDPANKTVVKVYYDRNSYDYSVTHTTGVDVRVDATTKDGTKIKYGDEVTLSYTEQSGYVFESWTVTGSGGNNITVTDNKFPMPAGDVTIKANLTATDYTIRYVLHSGTNNVENPASYNVESEDITLKNPTRDHSVFKGWKGTSGTTEPAVETIDYILHKGSVGDRTYEAIWGCEDGYHLDGDSCEANEYTITVNYDDDDKPGEVTLTGKYGDWTEIENPSKSGYTFAGWNIEGMSGNVTHYIGGSGSTTSNTGASGVMGTGFKNLTTEYPNGEVTFTAEWIANDDTYYEVYHYVQNTGGTAYEPDGEAIQYSGTSDEPINLGGITKSYSGFIMTGRYLSGTTSGPIGEKQTSITIDRHGTTKIYIYYDRDVNSVYLSGDAHVESVSWDKRDFRYGEEVTVSATVATGYHFVQWKKKQDSTFTTDL